MAKLKLGDWVKSTIGVGTGKIIEETDGYFVTDFGLMSFKHDMTIRPATNDEIFEEKRRRWYREVGKISGD